MSRRPTRSTRTYTFFPYTTLVRSNGWGRGAIRGPFLLPTPSGGNRAFPANPSVGMSASRRPKPAVAPAKAGAAVGLRGRRWLRPLAAPAFAGATVIGAGDSPPQSRWTEHHALSAAFTPVSGHSILHVMHRPYP